MKAPIFNIQKFSIHDGPGIRTTVFFKGCPLRCKWCANPESQIEKPQIMHDSKKCMGCKKCITACAKTALSIIPEIKDKNPVYKVISDTYKCHLCFKCIDACPTGALSYEGDFMTIPHIVNICKQDMDFYLESGGGVTLSGGEPLAHSEYVKALICALRQENISVAVETTGHIQNAEFKQLVPLFDLILFDIKHWDTKKHEQGTGVANELILQNFKWGVAHANCVLSRIPVIPDFNDSLEDALQFAKLLKTVGANKVQLLPFHQFGEHKYSLLHKVYEYQDHKAYKNKDLEEYKQTFIDNGIDCFF